MPTIIQANNLSFHTEHFGDPNNPACLLITGAMATALFWTDTFCNHLANHGFFVIRYDHRDSGESSAVNWEKNPYTLSDLAHDAISILDGYKIQQAHFIGHSMGGYIVQTIALEFPKRALSISAISAGPISGKEQPLTDQEQAILNTTWKVLLNRQDGPTKESTIQSFLPVWKYLNGEFPLDEQMAERYTRDLILRSRHPIRAGNNHELVMRSLKSQPIHKITTPTLIIHGDRDPLSLPRDGKTLASSIPHSRLVMVPGMGHMLFNHQLELIIAELVLNHMNGTFI